MNLVQCNVRMRSCALHFATLNNTCCGKEDGQDGKEESRPRMADRRVFYCFTSMSRAYPRAGKCGVIAFPCYNRNESSRNVRARRMLSSAKKRSVCARKGRSGQKKESD